MNAEQELTQMKRYEQGLRRTFQTEAAARPSPCGRENTLALKSSIKQGWGAWHELDCPGR